MTAGRNVWYDLMTTDTEGAKRFYGEVLGWTTEPWADAPPGEPYTLWKVGERPIGGLMPLQDAARSMGAPPHWLAYTTVTDVDATVAKAQALGATVVAPAFDVPKAGRIAVLADPQGASFAVFASGSDELESASAHALGCFGWAELNTTDWQAAWKFYSDLLGWQVRGSVEMGPMGTYHMFQDPTKATMGGMSNAAEALKVPPHWLHYVTVEGLDAALERVAKHGGKVLMGPQEVPGGDRIAQCKDPQGAYFALYERGAQG